jgi:hypothetical protein
MPSAMRGDGPPPMLEPTVQVGESP